MLNCFIKNLLTFQTARKPFQQVVLIQNIVHKIAAPVVLSTLQLCSIVQVLSFATLQWTYYLYVWVSVRVGGGGGGCWWGWHDSGLAILCSLGVGIETAGSPEFQQSTQLLAGGGPTITLRSILDCYNYIYTHQQYSIILHRRERTQGRCLSSCAGGRPSVV